MEESKKRDGEVSVSIVSKKRKADANTEEKFINIFSEPPSLQSIAITSVAAQMWSCVPLDFGNFFDSAYLTKKLNDRFLNQLAECFLPDSLKIEVYNALRPAGHEIREYLSLCRTYGLIEDDNLVLGPVCWTMAGTIDKSKSLKELLYKEKPMKNYEELYELASRYCLEEYISGLWAKMPVYRRNKFIETICKNCCSQDSMSAYWTFSVSGSLLKLSESYNNLNLSMNESMVSWSSYAGNIYALKYFWQKLSEQEKSNSIEMLLERATTRIPNYLTDSFHNRHADVLYFLLTHMNDEVKQETFFRRHSSLILITFLQFWPFQRFFLRAISKMFDYLHVDTYNSVMDKIIYAIENKKQRFSKTIFQETWSISPSRLKNAYLENLYEECKLTQVLLLLVKIGNTKMAVNLLNEASSKVKESLTSEMFWDPKFKEFLKVIKDLAVIEPLLEVILHPDRDIQLFKQEVVLKCTRDVKIFNELLCSGDFQAIDTILKWLFQCEDEIENFKKNNLDPYKLCTDIMCQENIFNDFRQTLDLEERYDRVDEVLLWFFNTNEEIQEFKKLFE